MRTGQVGESASEGVGATNLQAITHCLPSPSREARNLNFYEALDIHMVSRNC